MKTLFTASTSHILRHWVDDELEELTKALAEQFPAYRVVETCKADFAAAVFVETVVPDAPIPAILNGWGHSFLTLKLVA